MGIEKSPARRKRERFGRKAQERRWASRSGPVRVVKPPEPEKK
jgi:hypothetical protein